MSRVLRGVLGAAVLVALVCYLAGQWQELRGLLRVGPAAAAALGLTAAAGAAVGAAAIRRLLVVFGPRPSLWEMFLLHNVTLLLNYLPFKAGTFYRANYLKRRYGLAYSHFAVLFVYLLLLMVIAASAGGLAALAVFYDLRLRETGLLAGLLGLFLAAALTLAFAPLPALPEKGAIGRWLGSFAAGRGLLARDRRAVAAGLILSGGCFVVSSLQIGIIYGCVGQELSPAGYLVLGAVAYVTMFLGITPGALGLRELALALAGVSLGVDFSVGSLAALLDRGVAIVWSSTVGVAAAAYLWYKYPRDFERDEDIHHNGHAK